MLFLENETAHKFFNEATMINGASLMATTTFVIRYVAKDVGELFVALRQVYRTFREWEEK